MGGEGEAWPSFNESSACGAVFTRTPSVAESGWIPTSTILRGPMAAMFGRTVDQVRADLVAWRGAGTAITVHERLLPALDVVTSALAAGGEAYEVDPRYTSSIAARTISGRTRLSRHTFGLAMDINADRNPFRGDNRLITDMPDSFVAAFEAGGFCWGGGWIGRKDAMHFAWQGPAFTPGATLSPSYPPLTQPVARFEKTRTIPVVPRGGPATFATLLADGDGDPAVDVVYLSRLGADLLVDASAAAQRHNACSLRRSVVVDAPLPVFTGFGDWDGRGGQDLWLATEDENGSLRLTVRYRYGDYSAETAVTTSIPMPAPDAWVTTADHDRDGSLDLFVAEGRALRVWSVEARTGRSSLLFAGTLPLLPETLMIGDRDGDELPDLWFLSSGSVAVTTAAGGYRTVEELREIEMVPDEIVDAAVSDYDGDGRGDIVVFDGHAKHVWLGNEPLPDGAPLEQWFESEEPECGEDEPVWDELGVRYGTGGFVAAGAAEWLERSGFAARCDPTNEDIVCPPRPVTAGELAASMAWMLDLEPGPGSGFDSAGAALRRAGHDTPCRPGDATCWARIVPRAEVAVRFWQLLDRIDGRAPDPHRWVWPATLEGPGSPEPF